MKTLRLLPNHSAYHHWTELLARQKAIFRHSEEAFRQAARLDVSQGYSPEVRALYEEANRLHDLATNLILTKHAYRQGQVVFIQMQKPDQEFALLAAECRHLAAVKRLKRAQVETHRMFALSARAHTKD